MAIALNQWHDSALVILSLFGKSEQYVHLEGTTDQTDRISQVQNLEGAILSHNVVFIKVQLLNRTESLNAVQKSTWKFSPLELITLGRTPTLYLPKSQQFDLLLRFVKQNCTFESSQNVLLAVLCQ